MVIIRGGHLGHSRRVLGEGREIRFTVSQHVCNKHQNPLASSRKGSAGTSQC